MRRRSTIAIPATTLAVAILLTACDIGDGTTLQDPVAPTTLPPIDTTPLPSLPLDTTPLVQTPIVDEVLPGDPTDVDPSGTVDTGVPVDDAPDGSEADTAMFRVNTPWLDGATVNPLYTCDGTGEAPDVAWLDVPDGTVELAVSLVDESNVSNGRAFVHWVVAGIDPAIGQLVRDDLPPGAFEAINFFGDVDYGEPCPAPGTTGEFVLSVYAVSQQVEAGFDTPAADVLDVVESVAFDVATVSGTYTR